MWIELLDQDRTPGPLHWELGALVVGPPGKPLGRGLCWPVGQGFGRNDTVVIRRSMGFPGGASCNNLPANAGKNKRT